MDQAARNIQRGAHRGTSAAGVSLQIVSRQPAHQTRPAAQPCLVYSVTLHGPAFNSMPTRRLRLKDSLAGGTPSRNAGLLARDPHFWDYLQQFNLAAYDAEIDRRRARHFINRACGVEGRYDLDRSAGAAERFFRLVEQPFLNWLFADIAV